MVGCEPPASELNYLEVCVGDVDLWSKSRLAASEFGGASWQSWLQNENL